ncbi:TetR family transcriptional regulator [Streptomyces sp. CFMR 7]|uniref:TetR/AcrR family transcriptional regulator n=1 Tax=Streptomyces sp. CFMR 7 TaxID=1649184 RepID=UPI0006AD421B|nr:TetR family transcriptional regulator [Streptomyces sp. CFMR 7]ALC29158.1 TetR family transcriptional regulator [Streptomyces sp. CFMR 7]
MPPDATATKKRLLTAAYNEFAQFGLAGARVDRIAEAAQANKRLIYVHFGNKSDLFDLVVANSLADLATAVPFTAEDLPGYAGRLFDYLLEHPQVLRLTGWSQLERPEASPAQVDAYRPKIAAIEVAQQQERVTTAIAPTDVLALLLGLTTAWANASPALRSLAGQQPWDPERLRVHRTAMIAAVQALTTPTAVPGHDNTGQQGATFTP